MCVHIHRYKIHSYEHIHIYTYIQGRSAGDWDPYLKHLEAVSVGSPHCRFGFSPDLVTVPQDKDVPGRLCGSGLLCLQPAEAKPLNSIVLRLAATSSRLSSHDVAALHRIILQLRQELLCADETCLIGSMDAPGKAECQDAQAAHGHTGSHPETALGPISKFVNLLGGAHLRHRPCTACRICMSWSLSLKPSTVDASPTICVCIYVYNLKRYIYYIYACI